MVFLLSLVLGCTLLSCSNWGRFFDSWLLWLGLSLLLELLCGLGRHSTGKVGSLLKLVSSLTDLEVLSSDIIGVLFLKVDTDLVVDE